VSRRVLSVSSSRADVGILTPVWEALASDEGIDLHVMFTGMHLADGASVPVLPDRATGHNGGMDIAGSAGHAATAIAAISAAAGDLCAAIEPDLLLVIGDRLDMFPAVAASVAFNIPVVHLAGGDLTLGAIDDRLRHAITKLSHVHCAINVEAAYRIAEMGEQPWRIHVTGATGLDALLAAPHMSAQSFLDEVGLEEIRGLRLVTLHPETNAEDPEAPLTAVLAALDVSPRSTLFTAPNSDPGGQEMLVKIRDYVASRPWAEFRDTLGTRLYANALRLATVMAGNSSSGIVEAALFGLNVINVGRRQEGRACGANVHHCANNRDEVVALLARLNAPASGQPTHSLYGDGRSAERVARVIAGLPERAKLLRKVHSTAAGDFSPPWSTDDGAAPRRQVIEPRDGSSSYPNRRPPSV